MAETYPADGLEPVRFKDAEHYLTNPVWVGEGVPKWYMQWPWGLGGECWYVGARGRGFRLVFAGMCRADVVAAAERWLEEGAPALTGLKPVPSRPVPVEPVPASPAEVVAPVRRRAGRRRKAA